MHSIRKKDIENKQIIRSQFLSSLFEFILMNHKSNGNISNSDIKGKIFLNPVLSILIGLSDHTLMFALGKYCIPKFNRIYLVKTLKPLIFLSDRELSQMP